MLPWELGLAGACMRSVLLDAAGGYAVRRALHSGAAVSPWPGVLVDARVAAEPLTLISAAWLATGGAAVVAGPSAAHLHGLRALPPTPVHVAVPYGTRRRSRPGLVVHNGPDLAGDHVVVAGLPVLRPERVVADLLCTARPPDALAITDEALLRTPEEERAEFRSEVRARLLTRPDPRGTLIGSRLLELATGLAESPPESRLLWRIVDLGFPVPEVNGWVHDIDGVRLHRLDLSWPELRIAVEYDGYAAHVGREGADAARTADLEARGWIVVRADKRPSWIRRPWSWPSTTPSAGAESTCPAGCRRRCSRGGTGSGGRGDSPGLHIRSHESADSRVCCERCSRYARDVEILTAGRAVPVLTSGSGPGVVLVHGGGVGLVDYRRPIARLAERFTVHAYSRYAEPPGEYDLDADVELLRRVVEETGARGVIGHSIGGNVVLQALLRGLPVERAVLYDAAVCVEGAGFPTWFVEPMAEAVRAGDMPLAIALVGKGLGNGGVRLPIPIGKVVGALFLRTSIGRRMAERLPTVVGEARAAIADDGPASRFAPITAEVLMAYGASGPAYFGSTARAVAEALPHGRALAIPRARHDALNRGGERFLAPIAEFLAG